MNKQLNTEDNITITSNGEGYIAPHALERLLSLSSGVVARLITSPDLAVVTNHKNHIYEDSLIDVVVFFAKGGNSTAVELLAEIGKVGTNIFIRTLDDTPIDYSALPKLIDQGNLTKLVKLGNKQRRLEGKSALTIDELLAHKDTVRYMRALAITLDSEASSLHTRGLALSCTSVYAAEHLVKFIACQMSPILYLHLDSY